jgi:hypothetical protein
MNNEWCAEITVFQKHGGILSKRIWLDGGKVVSDGSACLMSSGRARRAPITGIHAYADLVNSCAGNEAFALGRLIDNLPNDVRVVTAEELNGGHELGVIARTKQFLTFQSGKGGLAPFDFDPKCMSEPVKQRFDEAGGFFGALCVVLPALETVAMVKRSSTSSGLRLAILGDNTGVADDEIVVGHSCSTPPPCAIVPRPRAAARVAQ